ncbi:hypothetical protein CEE37_13375 [candidate division LCP-89 bacterium B3_LCP]|uniref:Glycosyltransferase RgtA/B/C/D-like domain-containing protein n=1 Tax=candidate division LCP-89 bacterium B3_LCP TaxID=2012998 RepID=A0A532USN8_UNCL8|nr:MAG: hypothetical protein CEE37_13375 [candidate division LCP-89 bacterium B3_LCP]
MTSADRSRDYIGLAAILIITAATRFIGLGYKIFWFDEGATTFIVKGVIDQYFHPPAYYCIVRFVTNFMGESEYTYRFTSAFFGWLTVLFVYLLAGHLFRKIESGRNLALFAGLITATSPYMVAVSQENRPYALIAFVAVSSTYCLLKALELPRKKSLRWWIAYLLVISLGCYSHIFAFTLLLAGNFYFLLLKISRKSALTYRYYLFVQIAVILIYLPQLTQTFDQVGMRSYTLSKVFDRLGPIYYAVGTMRTFYRFSVGSIFAMPGVGFVKIFKINPQMAALGIAGLLTMFGGILCAIWGLTRHFVRRRHTEFAIFGFSFVILLLLVSLTLDDAKPRQLAHVAPFFIVMIAGGVGLLEKKWKVLAISLILSGTIALHIPYAMSETYPFSTFRWDNIAAYLNENVDDEDVVFINAGTREGYYTLKYYGCDRNLRFAGREHMSEDMPVRYYYDEKGRIHVMGDSALAARIFRETYCRQIWFVNLEYIRSDLHDLTDVEKAEGDFGMGVEVLVVNASNFHLEIVN